MSLPAMWNLHRLADIAEVSLGKTPRKPEYADRGVAKILKYRDLRDGEVDWGNDAKGFLRDGTDARLLVDVRPGDVLVGASAHSSEHVGRKVVLVRDVPSRFERSFVVGELLRLRPTSKVRSRFVCAFFQSREGYSAVQRRVRGGHLLASEARTIEIPLPSLEEQDRIIAEVEKQFTRLDVGVAALERLQVHLRRYRAAVLKAAFGGDVASTWREASIEDIATLVTKGTTPTSVGFDFTDSGIRFVKAESLVDGQVAHELCAHIGREAQAALARSQLQARDVLFSIAGTLGRVAVVRAADVPANTNQAICLIRLADPRLAEWVAMFLASPSVADQVRTLKRGVGLYNLNLAQVRALRVPVPAVEEALAIVETVKSTLSRITRLQEEVGLALRRAARLRASILCAAFEGRLVASEQPARAPAA